MMKLLRETVRRLLIELGDPELEAASRIANVAHKLIGKVETTVILPIENSA